MKLTTVFILVSTASLASASVPQDAQVYNEPGIVYCGEGSTEESAGGTCWISPSASEVYCDYSYMESLGQPLMGSSPPATGDIKSFFPLFSGCSVACTGCTFVPNSAEGCRSSQMYCPTSDECVEADASDFEFRCDPTCNPGSTGYEWCPATNTCVRPFDPGTPAACGGSTPAPTPSPAQNCYDQQKCESCPYYGNGSVNWRSPAICPYCDLNAPECPQEPYQQCTSDVTWCSTGGNLAATTQCMPCCNSSYGNNTQRKKCQQACKATYIDTCGDWDNNWVRFLTRSGGTETVPTPNFL